jgi:hypothetical protein
MRRNATIAVLVVLAGFVSAASAQILLVASLDSSGTGHTSRARGTAWAVLSKDMSTLTYQVTYNTLEGTYSASHFHHSGAVTSITFTGNTSAGVWSGLSDAEVRDLLTGAVYVNVHSSIAPGGEIKGYLQPVQGIGFTVNMDGTQAGTASAGRGTAWVVLDSVGRRVRWDATVSGLPTPITAAHFHYPVGIAHATPFNDSTSSGIWSAIPDSVAHLLVRGSITMNVHTTTYPGGEIRGAVLLAGDVAFVTSLDSTGTGHTSDAKGTVWGILSKDASTLTYQATYNHLQGTYSASHFHHSSGLTPIAFTGTTSSGQWTNLTDADLRDLLRGTVYVNVHSSVAPGGEIKGYLMSVDGIGLIASMDGSEAGTPSPGMGTAWVVLDSSSARVRWNATVSGLTAPITAAHFHFPSGVHGTPFADSASTGTWSGVPDSLAVDFAKGIIYMNVHTSNYPGGEIRGTLRLDAGVTTAVAPVPPARPFTYRLDQNYPNPFNPSTTISFEMPEAAHVTLTVYNILGQNIATLVDGVQAAGIHRVQFSGRNLASGVYFYRLSAGQGSGDVRRMMLVQ